MGPRYSRTDTEQSTALQNFTWERGQERKESSLLSARSSTSQPSSMSTESLRAGLQSENLTAHQTDYCLHSPSALGRATRRSKAISSGMGHMDLNPLLPHISLALPEK